jgi:4-diphosphocytidyl-2-C-methyl-D-erythritol kinase
VITGTKVNLAHRILGRLPDGYHAVDTVLATLDLGDRLSVEVARPGSLDLVVTGTESVPAREENLVFKAARLALDASAARGRLPARHGIRLRLHKRVPAGAGLGGGSGDAAAALLLVNRLLGLGLRRRELLALARRLGADVPFFLGGGVMRGRHKGELLRPLADLPELPALILVPPFRLATRDVYRWLRRFSLTSPATGFRMRAVLSKLRSETHGAVLVNDLELPVFRRYPELAKMKRALEGEGALLAGLSGSGSAIFGLFPSGSVPGSGFASRRGSGWTVLRCRTLAGRSYRARFRSSQATGLRRSQTWRSPTSASSP